MSTDTGSPGEKQIWQCSNPNCGFRFPLLVHSHLLTNPTNNPDDMMRCPRCSAHSQLVFRNINAPSPQENPSNQLPTSGKLTRLNEPNRNAHPVDILLDNIRSTFNVGAIFRSSDGAGVRHIHLCGTTPTPDNPKISKTALGAEYSVPWSYHPNAVFAAKNLCQRQQPSILPELWALEGGPDSENLFEVIASPMPASPIILVVGNEVSGVDPELLAMCHKVVAIPMLGYKRSLNVAIAFGIAVYAISVSAPILAQKTGGEKE